MKSQLWILSAVLTGFYCSGKAFSEGKKPNIKTQDKPWLLVTTFNHYYDSANTAELRQGKGFLYKLKGSDTKLQARWLGEFKPFKTVTISEFIKSPQKGFMFLPIDSLNGLLKVVITDSVDFFETPQKWRFIEKGQIPFDYKKQISLISITGVTAITRAMGIVADNQGIDFLTENLKPWFSKTDVMHISNEVSFTPDCIFPRGGTKFCSKKEHFKAITDLGCDIIELTGNHNRDHGMDAFVKTYEWYTEQGIKPFGGGRNAKEANQPAIVTLKDSTRIGFIGFNELCPLGECAGEKEPGANRWDSAKARKVIGDMKTRLKCNFVIVSMQFGEIDAYTPSATQSVICKQIIDFGADMLYGSQAHQIQQVTFYKNKPIYYGLGNFLFDQIHRIGVRQAFFLQNYFFKGKLIATKPVFTFMSDIRQPGIANEKQEWEMKKLVYP
ncbi:MAG: CapA family protein [Sphingomonadales bacterium]|nr:CapA family protein [Sphingomonadales bacterium]